jgi:DNA-directed RNA polymerase specialized sigma subunit
MSEDSSKHFRKFATALEARLAKYPKDKKESLKLQKKQVEKLIELEAQWKAVACKRDEGKRVYSAFINHIIHQRKNILDARPFFRERQTVFMKKIAPALREGDWKKLASFRINWSFIAWALKEFNSKPKKLADIASQISKLRMELVEANLPLIIVRSRIFWGSTPKSHLSFMDMISIASEGLISAVDKFVPPFTKVFASVASYRCVGNLIEAYNETMLHFWPSDRRKLYRANKFLAKYPHGAEVSEDLVKEVNREAPPRQKADEAEIRALMLAASTVSADATPTAPPSSRPGTGDTGVVSGNISRFAAPDSDRPDVRFEQREAEGVMQRAAKTLTLWEKKLLKLKGVNIDLKKPVDMQGDRAVN